MENNQKNEPQLVAEQNVPVAAPQEKPVKNAKLKETIGMLWSKLSYFKVSKRLVVAVAGTVFVILILSVALTVINRKGGGLIPLPTPSPTPGPTPEVEVPSEYADDDDVKAIQERMTELEKNLNEKSFRDDTLRIPSLDWDVSFQ